jgi:hypothetical protein
VTYSSYAVFGGQDSIPTLRNIYTYPKEGVEVIVESFNENGVWIPLSEVTILSDDLGRIVEITALAYNPETGEYLPDSKIKVYPHGNAADLVDSLFIYVWSVELQDWYRPLATINSYDDLDRITESLSSIEFFEFPIVFLDKYAYNTDGDLMRIDSYNVDGEELYDAGRQEMWYDDHLLTLLITSVSDGANGFITESKTEYSYTDFRKVELTAYSEVDPETNDWKLIRTEGYVYDEEERVVEKGIVALNDQDIWFRQNDVYTYAQGEYLASEGSYSYDNNLEDWVLEEKKYYYYNELTAIDPLDPFDAEALYMWPNPSSGIVNIKLDNEMTVDIYALSGQLIGSYQLTTEVNTINLTALPAGIYEVRAKSEDAYYAGRLVLQGQ